MSSSGSESSVEFAVVDPESETFDPLKALYSEVIGPKPNIKVYDNVQQFDNYIKLAKQGLLRKRLEQMELRKTKHHIDGRKTEMPSSSSAAVTEAASGTSATASSSGEQPKFIIPGRMFTASQAPVTSKRADKKTVLSKMDNMTGPLSRIKHFMDQRLRVKVTTRNYNEIRGVCEGYIVAFDKHWNICLTDVDETYRRRIRRKLVYLGDPNRPGASEGRPTTSRDGLGQQVTRAPLARPPTASGNRRRPLWETVQRHINQLFIRGDNVVSVCSPAS